MQNNIVISSKVEWRAAISFERYELRGSYSILFFLGPVPEDPGIWEIAPDLISKEVVFESLTGGPSHLRNMVERGSVELNDGIIKHSGLAHLTPETVVPYLTKNFHWRVIWANHESG